MVLQMWLAEDISISYVTPESYFSTWQRSLHNRSLRQEEKNGKLWPDIKEPAQGLPAQQQPGMGY